MRLKMDDSNTLDKVDEIEEDELYEWDLDD